MYMCVYMIRLDMIGPTWCQSPICTKHASTSLDDQAISKDFAIWILSRMLTNSLLNIDRYRVQPPSILAAHDQGVAIINAHCLRSVPS